MLLLIQKRNIRESLPKRAELLQQLQDITGIAFSYEVDFQSLVGSLSADSLSSYGDRIGSVVNEWYLSPFVQSMKRFCENPMQRESVHQLATARCIRFNVVQNDADWPKMQSHGGNYCRTRLEQSGVVILECKKSTFCSNVDNIADNLSQVFAGSGPLSLNCRVNIESNQPRINELLEEISQATGVQFSLEVDYPSVLAGLPNDQKLNYGERLGEVMVWYLEPMSYKFKSACADSMKKESVIELAAAKKISFQVFPTEKEYRKAASWGSSYCRCRLVDGVLYIETRADSFCSNVSNVLDCFDDCFAGNSDFPLVVRANLQENAPKIDETLQELRSSTGVEFEFECDYGGLYGMLPASVKSSYGDRIGEVMLWYLQALQRGLDSKIQNPLRKEAIQELCTAKKITFRMFPNAAEYKKACSFGGNYCRIRLVDGVLVMETKDDSMCSNIDYIADCFDDCFAGSPDFPLTLRVNIKEYQEKLDEAIEEIEEHTGVKFEFECDYPGLFKSIPADRKRDYGNRLGETAQWYLQAVSRAFSYKCQNALRKEAVAELCTAKRIGFALLDKNEYKKLAPWGSSYGRCRLVDGVLVIEVPADNFCSNVDEVLSSCFDNTFMGDPLFPLAARVDIAEYQPQRDADLEKISTAVGKPFTFQVDWPALTKLLESRGYPNRHGETMHWYLEALASNVERLCADELGKEAINEKFPTDGVVRFVEDTAATGYVQTSFEAPNSLWIKVHPEKICSNVSETGNDLEKQL